jgi:hypothetical protein
MNSRRFNASASRASDQKDSTGQECCAAGFQSGLCPLWVHKQTKPPAWTLSALPPKADIVSLPRSVRFVPKAAICSAADIAGVAQALAERAQTARVCVGRIPAEKSDHRHRRLLRPRRERPSGHTAAEKRDEFPPPHGAFPKAKDHGRSIAGLGVGQWRASH